MRFILSLWILFASSAFADKLAPRMGHNLSATTYKLDQGQCTLGVQVVGCGATDNLMMGTVPWLYANYNMWSVVSRYRLITYPGGGAWSLQFAYFKSFPQKRNDKYVTYPYDMEAIWFQIIRSIPMAKHYRMYVNLHLNDYINDHRPFSMRRPIPNANDGQINLTTLHEVALVNRFFLMAELGLVEIAQPTWPHVHVGLSAGRSGFSYEWHLGFSLTSTPLALFNPRSRRDYQQELRDTDKGFDQELDREKTVRDYAIHPEFALQYFF